jgi:hypothetical protein
MAWQWVENGGDQYSFRGNAQEIDEKIGEVTQDIIADQCDMIKQYLV